jgi:ankyrin repeat protein
MDKIPSGPFLDCLLPCLEACDVFSLMSTTAWCAHVVKQYQAIASSIPGADDALIHGVRTGNIALVRFSLLVGAQVEAKKNVALKLACHRGYAEIVRLLLEAGGCALGRDESAESQRPLMIATINNTPDVVEALITSTKSAKDREMLVHTANDTCLRLAAQEGYAGIVRVLLDNGANFLALNSAALTLSSRYGYEEIVRLLLQAGDDVHSDDDRALREASLHGHLGVVEILLEAGADVYAKNMAALVNAVRNGHEKVAQRLRTWK